MKVLIFAGGTGSIALQRGIGSVIENSIVSRDNLDIKILVNAYDNGKSTGTVRKVFNGAILGPSDVRKNHTTRLSIENPTSPWLKFLDIRFSSPADKARSFCLTSISSLRANLLAAGENLTLSVKGELVDKVDLVKEAVNVFFATSNSRKIDYDDFSIANIIYAGFAASNDFSLRKAATIMANLLGIKDNVILNDDTSLMLGAITKSGRFLTDEGDIVCWGNVADPIVDTIFTNPVSGEASRPVLCEEGRAAILEADMIIMSSGTQWSSLIPTYESGGFKDAIRETTAKVIMVMNRTPDKDAPGASASDIIKLLVSDKQYFRPGQINLVIDAEGEPSMSTVNDNSKRLLASVTTFNNKRRGSLTANSKHSPENLATVVFYSYYAEYLDSKHFMFDYDDTLVGRGNTFEIESNVNLSALNSLSSLLNVCNDARGLVSICTGNSVKAVKLPYKTLWKSHICREFYPESARGLTVFADGGINQYTVKMQELVDDEDDYGDLESAKKITFTRCIDPGALLTITDKMSINDVLHHRLCIPKIKVENRGDAMIAIKPIDEEYRPALINFLDTLKTVGALPSELKVQSTGRGTIELKKTNLSKETCVRHMVKVHGQSNITYVGDEFFAGGNDYPVRNVGVKCLNVASPVETALFMQCLLTKVKSEQNSQVPNSGLTVSAEFVQHSKEPNND